MVRQCCKLTCVCQENFELERQLRRKEAELAEAEGQLTERVDITMCIASSQNDNPCFYVQEEQLQSSEREKQTVRQQLMSSQGWIQELRLRVSLWN